MSMSNFSYNIDKLFERYLANEVNGEVKSYGDLYQDVHSNNIEMISSSKELDEAAIEEEILSLNEFFGKDGFNGFPSQEN